MKFMILCLVFALDYGISTSASEFSRRNKSNNYALKNSAGDFAACGGFFTGGGGGEEENSTHFDLSVSRQQVIALESQAAQNPNDAFIENGHAVQSRKIVLQSN